MFSMARIKMSYFKFEKDPIFMRDKKNTRNVSPRTFSFQHLTPNCFNSSERMAKWKAIGDPKKVRKRNFTQNVKRSRPKRLDTLRRKEEDY